MSVCVCVCVCVFVVEPPSCLGSWLRMWQLSGRTMVTWLAKLSREFDCVRVCVCLNVCVSLSVCMCVCVCVCVPNTVINERVFHHTSTFDVTNHPERCRVAEMAGDFTLHVISCLYWFADFIRVVWF